MHPWVSVRGRCFIFTVSSVIINKIYLKYYDGNNQKISAKDYSISDIADYQKFELEDQVSSVEIECCGADGAELETRILTKEGSNTTLVYSDGGQFLGAKTLLFVWDQ